MARKTYASHLLPYFTMNLTYILGTHLGARPTLPLRCLKSFTDFSAPAFIPFSDAKHVLEFDKTWKERVADEVEKSGPLPSPPALTLNTLAYTVYSSGTTGKPKGVVVVVVVL